MPVGTVGTVDIADAQRSADAPLFSYLQIFRSTSTRM